MPQLLYIAYSSDISFSEAERHFFFEFSVFTFSDMTKNIGRYKILAAKDVIR